MSLIARAHASSHRKLLHSVKDLGDITDRTGLSYIKKAQKALVAYGAFIGFYETASKFYSTQKKRFEYTVRINAQNPLYHDLNLWVTEMVPPPKRRNLIALYNRREEDPPIDLIYQGSPQKLKIGGHDVTVHIDRPDHAIPQTERDEDIVSVVREYLVFTTFTVAGRDAVVKFLRELAEARRMSDYPPQLFVRQHSAPYFTSKSYLGDRSFDSVVLKRQQQDRIVADLKRFYAEEERYGRIGVPYHRGYLFHGPPGTGKTSTAKAIANEFDKDIFYLSIPSIKTDSDLNSLVGNVHDGGILLLEDVDVASAAKERTDTKDGVTLSGLLNVLDGVATPHGLVTVMTTNHLEALDPALIRPGRIDLVEELSYLDNYQKEQMFFRFYDEKPQLPTISEDDKITPADLINLFKIHTELDRALSDFDRLIEAKRAGVQFVPDQELEIDEKFLKQISKSKKSKKKSKK